MTPARHLAVLLFIASLGFDWPQLPGGARVAELLFVPAMAAVAIAAGRGPRFHAIDAAVIAYLAGSAVGLIASSDPAVSSVEWLRHAYLAIVYVLAAMAVIRGFRDAVVIGFVAMGAVPAIAGLCFAIVFIVNPMIMPSAAEAMNLPYVGELLRLRAFTASPTMLACVLTVSLPFAMAAWTEGSETQRRRAAVAIGLIAVALVMTFSHAWAGAAFAVLVMSWPLLERYRPLRMASVSAVALLAIVLNLSLVASIRALSAGDTAMSDRTSYHYGVGNGTRTIGPVTVDYTVMSYFRTKQLALEAFADHPLTGIGLDRFHDVTEAAYREGRLTYGYREIDPHSSILGRLAETGLFGGLTLVVLWVAIIVTARPLIRRDAADPWLARAALAGFAGLLLAGINVDIMNFRFLWAGVGVLRGLADGNG